MSLLDFLDKAATVLAPVVYLPAKAGVNASDHANSGSAQPQTMGGSGAAMAPVVPLPPVPTGPSAVQQAAYGTPQQQQDYAEYQQYAGTPLDPVQFFGQAPGTVITQNGQPLGQQPGLLAQAQAQRDAILGGYQTNANNYTNTLDDVIGGLTNQFGQLNTMDMDALAAANAGIAGLSQAPLSLASSDPADVARQQQAYGMLMGAAGGSMDASTNPEDLARQQKTADLLWQLAQSPELTAQERFIYEKQRQVEEQDRHNAMTAALSNLASRGMLGSGGEIGAVLGAQQTTSQNRVLGDLGALANAVDRQMNALGQHSALATNMRNASDAMTSGNMDRRLSGANGAANTATAMRNASDDIAMFNSGQTNTYNQNSLNLAQYKAQQPFLNTNAVTGQVGNRTGQIAGITADAAANKLNALNQPLNARAGFANQDLQTGLTLAQDAETSKWRQYEAQLDVYNAQQSQQNADKALEAQKPKPTVLDWLGLGSII